MAINPYEPPKVLPRRGMKRDHRLTNVVLSVISYAIIHFVAFGAIVLLCGFVVPSANYVIASNTVGSWLVPLAWLCKIAALIVCAVASLPLVLPMYLSKWEW